MDRYNRHRDTSIFVPKTGNLKINLKKKINETILTLIEMTEHGKL